MARLRAAILCGLLVLVARPALADATFFLGATMTPSNRPVLGGAVGLSFLVIGIEFEYAATGSDEASGAPSLKVGMGNILLQTPGDIGGMQLYATTGFGFYRESLLEHRDTSVGTNLGGGVKVNLIGPVRLRIDYRMTRLGDDALHATVHRLYAGLNLKF
jgi:opacity protein-like surface antigen